MTLSFRSKLLASHIALVVVVGLVAVYVLDRWLKEDLVRQLDTRLEEQAKGAIEWAAEGGRRHPDKVATRIAHIVDAEVTLLDGDGTVLAASSPEGRADIGPEIETARSGRPGHASRLRDGQEYHYVAAMGAEGIVVRIAIPLSEVNNPVRAMRQRLVFTSGLAVLLAIVLGILASRVASRPLQEMTATATRLAQGDFDVPIDTSGRDEFGVLWRALKSLAEQLKARIGELVSERDHLSAILAGILEGVVVLDRDKKVIVANPAVEKILGTKGSLVGKKLDDVVDDEEIRRVIVSSFTAETELEVIDRRGTTLAIYVRPLPETAGGSVVAVLRDMTALRRLMMIRKDFVANVSHELRTPVTSIQGYAETLLRGTTDAETQKQFLEIVHRQAARIGTLVEQLLALSEIEARDRSDFVREPVAIDAVAQHVAETVRGRAESRKVKVAIDVSEDAIAKADPESLERALLNLVDNAIKYGNADGTVSIEAKREADRVVVTVADDGPGIAEEHLARLFERFYRVDPGRSRQHGGAGLGLSIVKHLVESMDGTIAVESEVGKGTRFVVKLARA